MCQSDALPKGLFNLMITTLWHWTFGSILCSLILVYIIRPVSECPLVTLASTLGDPCPSMLLDHIRNLPKHRPRSILVVVQTNESPTPPISIWALISLQIRCQFSNSSLQQR